MQVSWSTVVVVAVLAAALVGCVALKADPSYIAALGVAGVTIAGAMRQLAAKKENL